MYGAGSPRKNGFKNRIAQNPVARLEFVAKLLAQMIPQRFRFDAERTERSLDGAVANFLEQGLKIMIGCHRAGQGFRVSQQWA